MTDLSQTIIPKSDQINADDLISGPITVKITDVVVTPDAPVQPVSIFFEGDKGKPFRPCKSMIRVLVAAWGKDSSAFVGRSMTLYRDEKVIFGGLEVGGIRISHMSHIDRDIILALTVTKAKRAPFHVRKLVEQQKPAAPAADPTIVGQAKTAAKAGTDAFRAWWKDNPAHRPALSPMLPELQELCRQGDAILAQQTADPFSADPLPADYDPDAIAREAFAKTDADALAGEEA